MDGRSGEGREIGMKFSRINDNTVRCIVTPEDMEDMGVEIEDFFTDRDKSRAFFEQLVEMAAEEVDFHARSEMLAMQVMPLPDKSIAITFSDDQKESFQSMLDNIKDVTNLLEEQKNEIQQGKWPVLEEDKKEEGQSNGKSKKSKMICIFKFTSLDEIGSFAETLGNDTGIKSSIYKEEAEYFLVLEKGKLSKKLYRSICERALEFGKLEGEGLKRFYALKEHGNCIMKKKALDILYQIAYSC